MSISGSCFIYVGRRRNGNTLLTEPKQNTIKLLAYCAGTQPVTPFPTTRTERGMSEKVKFVLSENSEHLS